jgi:hypothetical protein
MYLNKYPISKRQRYKYVHNKFIPFAFVFIIIIIGISLIIMSKAETPFVSINADNGTLTPPAIKKSCSGSTDGNCVLFNSPPLSTYWMINDGELNQIVKAGLSSTILNYFFNNSHSLLISGDSPTIDAELPKASVVLKYDSESSLAAAARQGFPGNTAYIAYDNESWSNTPVNEQECPFDYAKLAESIVHEKGLSFIFTPGSDLSLNLESSQGCNTQPENITSYSLPQPDIKYSDYLNEDIAGLGAKDSDMFEIQAQELMNNSVDFTYFTDSAISEANESSMNKVPLLVGLTTDDSEQTMTLQEMMSAYDTTKNLASGYWLNVPNTGTPDPSLAISFLNAVYDENH